MLRGQPVPLPLDAFEARRLLFALLVIDRFASSVRLSAHPQKMPEGPARHMRAAAVRRRHVRPPRSC